MSQSPTRLLGVGLCALLLASAASAEGNPWYAGVAQSFTYDSNIYIAGSNQPRTSATRSTTTLFAGIDQPFGRQRFTGSVTARSNAYSGNSALNHVGYGINVGLDWETIERLSGNLSASSTRTLARFNPGDAPDVTSTRRNLEQVDAVSATARIGVVTALTLEGTLGHRELNYSAREFDFRELKQDYGILGVRYRFSGALVTGIALRHTQSAYPRFRCVAGACEADKVDRDDVDFTAIWTPTGASSLSARVSISRASHSIATAADFKGVTGSLTWGWQPTGKLRFTTALVRDTGVDSTFVPLSGTSISGITDNSRIANTVQVGAQYAVSAKVSAVANARYTQRSLVDTLSLSNGLVGTARGSDRTTGLSLGAMWTPMRSVQARCDISREERSASGGLSVGYGIDSVGCGAQFTLN